MQVDDPGLSAMMKRILEKRDEMLARIDENGILSLTMEDIRTDVHFEDAQVDDIKYSVVPAHRARRIVLSHRGEMRFLKDRIPAIEVREGECETCGGDQYLQPCPTCGEE